MSNLPNGTPVFTFARLDDFRALMLSLGGSDDVHSGAEVTSDIDVSGRYARNYSRDLPDQSGRTISFYASPNRPGTYDQPGYTPLVVLTGCPWGTAAERDGTYAALASCGCLPNDARRQDRALVAASDAARRGEQR